MRDRLAATFSMRKTVLYFFASCALVSVAAAQNQRPHGAKAPPRIKASDVKPRSAVTPFPRLPSGKFVGPSLLYGPPSPASVRSKQGTAPFDVNGLFLLPLPPVVPPPPPVRHVSWNATLPANVVAKATRIEIDANDIVGAFPTIIRGVIGNGGGLRVPETAWGATSAYLKALNAPLLRLEPLTESRSVGVDDAGNAVLHWAGPDAILSRAATTSAAVVFRISPPNLEPDKWAAFTLDVMRRYGANARYGVARWELACRADEVGRFYPAFARTARAVTPATPVGLGVAFGDPVDAARNLADACGLHHVECDSFSWIVSEDGPAPQTVPRIRTAFIRANELKGTTLLPEVGHGQSTSEAAEGPRMVSLLVHLAELASPASANPLLGALAPWPEPREAGGSGTSVEAALPALNRMAGARLNAAARGDGVRVLATRTSEGLAVLLWRDDRGAEDRLAMLHIKNMAASPLAGMRLERYEAADGLFRLDSSGRPPTSDSWTPAAAADVMGEGTELEAPVVLGPNTVTLVLLRPSNRPGMQIELAAPRFALENGRSFEVTATLKNNSQGGLPAALALSQMGGNLLVASSNRLSAGILAPGRSATFHIRLTAAAVARDRLVFLNASSPEGRASLTFKLSGSLEAKLDTPRIGVAAAGNRAEAAVHFVNSGTAPLQLAMRALSETEKPAELFEVPAKSTLIRRLTVVTPGTDPGIYPVDIEVSDAAGPVRAFRVWVGVPVSCRYTAVKPSFTGDRGEWADGDYIGLGRKEQAHGKLWNGPADLSAILYTKWDALFLYFAGAVTDDVFRQPFGAAEMWKGDSVQLAVRAGEGDAPTATRYGPGDFEFGVALVKGTPTLYRLAGGPGVRPGNVSGGRVAAHAVPGGVFYESAIPWTELGVSPKAGMELGISIVVNDNDGGGRGYMEWGGGVAGTKRPGVFPPLRLVR